MCHSIFANCRRAWLELANCSDQSLSPKKRLPLLKSCSSLQYIDSTSRMTDQGSSAFQNGTFPVTADTAAKLNTKLHTTGGSTSHATALHYSLLLILQGLPDRVNSF
mmetsp:Transcript_24770/g.68513  ORF Transcript_24770/g.68513 Transcript_24770/m.68513 type:complete len:107 (+) Transcript_24770:1493-1813(+)